MAGPPAVNGRPEDLTATATGDYWVSTYFVNRSSSTTSTHYDHYRHGAWSTGQGPQHSVPDEPSADAVMTQVVHVPGTDTTLGIGYFYGYSCSDATCSFSGKQTAIIEAHGH